jgi:hypothetical protein
MPKLTTYQGSTHCVVVSRLKRPTAFWARSAASINARPVLRNHTEAHRRPGMSSNHSKAATSTTSRSGYDASTVRWKTSPSSMRPVFTTRNCQIASPAEIAIAAPSTSPSRHPCGVRSTTSSPTAQVISGYASKYRPSAGETTGRPRPSSAYTSQMAAPTTITPIASASRFHGRHARPGVITPRRKSAPAAHAPAATVEIAAACVPGERTTTAVRAREDSASHQGRGRGSRTTTPHRRHAARDPAFPLVTERSWAEWPIHQHPTRLGDARSRDDD